MASDRRLLPVMAALMTCLLLSALDQTIVSTALPTMVGDLGGLDHISWVVTAYLLSSTAAVPLFGKISDIYGRKLMLQITIVIFLVGSVLAGMSPNMVVLILTRGIQGIGGGGMMAMTFTILGDILSPRERSKYTGYFTAVFASASVLGPLAGGFFVDHASWRWVFYVNLPLGVLAMVVVARFLHTPVPAERRRLDLLGAFLLTAAVVALLLASSWGGQEYAWGSTLIVGLLGGGALLLALFALHERRVEEQILPFDMFRDGIFRVCIAMGTLLGSVMVGAAVFLPLYLQVVKGVSATSSGFLLVPMMGGVVLGSNLCGRIVNLTGRYKIFTVVGSGIALAGIASLLLLERDTARSQVSLSMGLLGLGIGTCMPITTLAVQNIASDHNMGAATSAVNFFRSLGSSFGVAIFGVLMNTRLDSSVVDALGDDRLLQEEGLLASPEVIRALPAPQFDAVADGIVDGLHLIFLVGIPLMAATFVLSWLLREIPLRDDLDLEAAMVEGMEEAGMFAPPAETVAGHDGDRRVEGAVGPAR